MTARTSRSPTASSTPAGSVPGSMTMTSSSSPMIHVLTSPPGGENWSIRVVIRPVPSLNLAGPPTFLTTATLGRAEDSERRRKGLLLAVEEAGSLGDVRGGGGEDHVEVGRHVSGEGAAWRVLGGGADDARALGGMRLGQGAEGLVAGAGELGDTAALLGAEQDGAARDGLGVGGEDRVQVAGHGGREQPAERVLRGQLQHLVDRVAEFVGGQVVQALGALADPDVEAVADGSRPRQDLPALRPADRARAVGVAAPRVPAVPVGDQAAAA